MYYPVFCAIICSICAAGEFEGDQMERRIVRVADICHSDKDLEWILPIVFSQTSLDIPLDLRLSFLPMTMNPIECHFNAMELNRPTS